MSKAQATAAARVSREQLGLGLESPLPDVFLSVIEEHQEQPIPVTLLPLPDGVAGAYLRREGRPFIFINSGQWPVRRRFTLAHELGHIYLGHRPMIDTEDDIFDGSATREVEANAFAAEFLAPEAGVRSWVRTRVAPGAALTLEDVVRLAHYFRISAQSARFRLDAIAAISSPGLRRSLDIAIVENEHTHLGRRLGLTDEPGANGRDDIGRVEIGEYRATETALGNAIEAIRHRSVEVGRAAELLGVSDHELAALIATRGIELAPDEPEPAPLDED